MKLRHACLVLAAVALPAWALPRAARGEASEHALRAVRVVVAGGDKDVTAFGGSLSELLSRIGARADVARVERVDIFDNGSLSVRSPGTFATAWVDLTDTQHATVVLVEGATGRIVARRTVSRGARSDIAIEELAHIIQASVEDMVAEAPPPAPPPSAAPTDSAAPSVPASASASAPPSVTPPPPPALVAGTSPGVPHDSAPGANAGPRYGVDVGAFFVGRSFGGDASIVPGGGGAATLRLGRAALHPALSLSGAYHVPFDGSGTLVKVRASALSLRLSGTAQYQVSDKLLLELGPELGADLFFATPQALTVPQDRVTAGSTETSPMVGGVLGARYSITHGAEMFLLFQLDVDLQPHRYVVRDGPDVTETAFQPSRVRPALALGFDFTVAGRAVDPEPPR